MFGRARTTVDERTRSGPTEGDAHRQDGLEMLSLEDSPFGDAGPAMSWGVSEPEATGNRRGWIIGAAMLSVLVVAIVTVSVVTDHGDGGLTRVTPTTAAPNVAPSTPTTPAPVAAQVAVDTVPSVLVNSADDPFALDPGAPLGYVLGHAPDGLTQIGAYSFPNESGGNSQDADLQLWATPDATRSTGTWFVAQTQRVDSGFGFWPSGRRIAVGASTGVLVTAPDGVLELYLATTSTDGALATATAMAFGLPEAALVAIASTIEVGTDGMFSMTAPPPPMVNLVHSRSLPFGVLDGPGALQYSGTVTMTHYAAPTTDHTPATLRLSIAAADVSVDVAALLPFMLVDGHREEIDGRDVWIGLDPRVGPLGGTSLPMAVFAEGGRAVVVTGDLDVDVFHDALGSISVASNDTWRNLLVDTMRRDRTTVYPEGSPPGDATVIASGGTPGRPGLGNWQVSVDDGADVDMLVVEADNDGGYGIPMPTGPVVHLSVGRSRTIAVGIGSPGDGPTTLRLTLDGATGPEQVASSIDGPGRIPVAALAFDSLGGYRLDLLDASGRVIATIAG